MTNEHTQSSIRRAALPEVMFASDLALALDLTFDVAQKRARLGHFGPHFFVDGRVAVLRQDFLEFLTLRAAGVDAGDKEVMP